MAITIRDLNKGRQLLELVTIEFDKSVQSALSIMLEKNLSQLPVVDGDKKLMGIISMESILKAQQFFSIDFTDLGKLCVSHAAAKWKDTCKEDDDLSDIFEKVKQYGALIIVDSKDEKKPTGIICIDDLLDFYYRRAENILLLHNIETSLKDHIRSALNESDLEDRIDSITNSPNTEKLKKSIKHYKELENKEENNSVNIDIIVEKVFEKHWKQDPKSLDKLTLIHYIDLLISDDCANYRDKVFNKLESNPIKNLLNEVRKIRNDLFHFRREIEIGDYEKLRYCSDWLTRHPASINSPINDSYEGQNTNEKNKDNVFSENSSLTKKEETDENSLEMESSSRDVIKDGLDENSHSRKFSNLIVDLGKRGNTNDSNVSYSFKEIESLIGEKLPKGAREDRSWWSNDDSRPWVEEQWYVLHIDMIRENVTFVRKPYAKEYNEFFQSIFSELRKQDDLPFRVRSPYLEGRHFSTVTAFPTLNEPIGTLTYSFNNIHNNFRIELFIDKYDETKNKQNFNIFCQNKSNIENKLAVFGEMLWEPLERSRSGACRISLCYNDEVEVEIVDEPEKLNKLRTWANKAIVEFYNVLYEKYQEFSSNLFKQEL